MKSAFAAGAFYDILFNKKRQLEGVEKGSETMKQALVFLANGFEEIEAITLVDILRRAGIKVDMCSIHQDLEVEGAHGIKVKADLLLDELKESESYDALITPGGLPGATNLRDNAKVVELFKAFYDREGKTLASICAAPIILQEAGIAPEIAGTCYPGFDRKVGFKEYVKDAVAVDKNVVTSMGPATAFRLAIELVSILAGEEAAEALRKETLFQYR